MAWTDPGVLDAHVRRLDGTALVAFVVSLWGARGFETERDGAFVVARRDGETQVLYIPSADSAGSPTGTAREIDAVVAPGRSQAGETLAAEHGARHLDATGLAEMLRYAVEREAAADLCEDHFGATPAELTLPFGARARRTASRLGARTAVVVVAVLVLVVGAGAVLGPSVPSIVDGGTAGSGADGAPAAGAGGSTPTNTGSDALTTRTAGSGAGPTGSGVTDPSTVPGVSEAGIANASRLGRAHAAAVSGMESYTIWFDYYVPQKAATGQVQYDTDVRVQGERISVRASRERPGGERSVIETVYFDGANRYVAANGSDDFERIDGEAPTATPRAVPFTRPAAMVRTYLATPESSVRQGESDATGERYRLHGTGRPPALPETVRDYEMTALVGENGFVWAFKAEFTVYRDSDGDGVGSRERVRLTWTYDRIGETVVRLRP